MYSTRLLRQAIPLGMRTAGWVTDKPSAGFTLRSLILDEVQDNEILVEMRYSGICHTDIAVSKGMLDMTEFPAVLGHEGAGTIMALGEGVKSKSLKVGDSVVLSYNACQTCPACLSGQRAFCHDHPQVNHNAVRLSDRTTPARLLDGTPVRSQYFGHSSFAKHSVVHEDTVVRCDYPDQLATYAPLGCGFQTGAGAIFNVAKPQQHQTAVIFGMGTVGLAALMACKYIGLKRLIAVDLNNERLKLAAELGATDLLNAAEIPDVPQAIRALTERGADHTVECTGITSIVEDAVRSTAPQGHITVLGVPKPGSTFSIDALDFLLANKSIHGIIQGGAQPHSFLPFLIDLHRQGQFPLEKVCRVFSARHINQAIKSMHSGETIKPVLSWEDVSIDEAV
ncbi:unnamed protein product [Clonostachys rhizophaga]|uniref:Enoyl reductase (ER) domain-containing protein n=1 Tax=Clonostachys rhizophaga TaxID=160324 RepID=A0A9N9YPE1_9HYPO|nr:unnamed protein product [Clonostachys rhizophaga]